MTEPESTRTSSPSLDVPHSPGRPPETPRRVEGNGPVVGRLPHRQPQRAVVVLTGYLAAVGAATVLAGALLSGPLVILVAIGLAALLTVPAAVLLPVVATDGEDVDGPDLPVLMRRRSDPAG